MKKWPFITCHLSPKSVALGGGFIVAFVVGQLIGEFIDRMMPKVINYVKQRGC